MTTMKKFHWFWAWDDEKEEHWLEDMSKQGLHLKSFGAPGFYNFEQGMPIDYNYRLDYFINSEEKPVYLQLFQDAGWHHLGEMGGWQYFRKVAINDEGQEIYSDKESKAKKYQRIMMYLIIFLPIYLSNLTLLSQGKSGIAHVLTVVLAVFLLLYIYAMVKLLGRISRLKKKI